MCKRKQATVLAALVAAMIWASTASATLIPLPGFGSDDGSETFLPNSAVITTEWLDVPGLFGQPSAFGFFFANNPAVLVNVFGPEDLSAPFTFTEQAQINFGTGAVFDIDDNQLQSLFINTGGPIGFFFTYVLPLQTPNTIYSIPGMNAGGIDLVATFPSLGTPESYLLGFEQPPGQDQALAFEVAVGITRVAEPGTLLLLGLGMGVVTRYRKRLSS